MLSHSKYLNAVRTQYGLDSFLQHGIQTEPACLDNFPYIQAIDALWERAEIHANLIKLAEHTSQVCDVGAGSGFSACPASFRNSPRPQYHS